MRALRRLFALLSDLRLAILLLLQCVGDPCNLFRENGNRLHEFRIAGAGHVFTFLKRNASLFLNRIFTLKRS